MLRFNLIRRGLLGALRALNQGVDDNHMMIDDCDIIPVHLDRKKSPQPEFLHLTILIELAINRDVLNFRPPRCSVVEAQYLIKRNTSMTSRDKKQKQNNPNNPDRVQLDKNWGSENWTKGKTRISAI